MLRRVALLALLPLFGGCVVVQHKHSLIDFGEFTGPLTEAGLAGRLIVIAACSGGFGGVIVWLIMKARSRWSDAPTGSAPAEAATP
jgi:hypothetical protein